MKPANSSPHLHRPSHVLSRLCLLTCMAGAFTGTLLRADTVTDSFKGHPGGSPLSGAQTESGNKEWNASRHFTVESDGAKGWVVPASGKFGSALLEIPSDAKRLQIDLDVKVAADDVGWIAIGFGSGGNPSDTGFPGGLFLYLDNHGGSQIRADGLRLKLANKTVGDFQEGGSNHLRLSYEAESNSVSASINDITIADNLPVADFRPELAMAGFSNFGTNADSQITNFSLTIEGGSGGNVSAIPPPLPPKPENVFRVLFVGDSITNSKVNPTRQWTINAGMAASAVDKDFVSLVTAEAGKTTGKTIEKKVFAEYGGKVAGYLKRIAEYRPFQPDLAIVQFGENERGTPAEFEKDYRALLTEISSLSPKPKIVCVGVWAPGNGTPYTGRNRDMDDTVKKLAAEFGAAFAPVEKYAIDPACRGYGADAGVQWHPNDTGMEGYAREIAAAWKTLP